MAKDSSGRKLPWFKLWTKDFMADPVVQALTWSQRGRFLWGCMCSWETDTPGVAYETDWLAWFGDGQDAEHVEKAVLRPYNGGSLLVQKRLLEEYEEAKKESDRNHLRTAAATAARHVERNGDSTDNVTHRISEVRSQKSDNNKDNTLVADAPVVLPEWVPQEPFNGLVESRKKSRKPMTRRAKQLVVAKLDRLRRDGHDPAELLDAAIESGWMTVWPPKANGAAKPESDGWEVTR